jgi:hypothetical protein
MKFCFLVLSFVFFQYCHSANSTIQIVPDVDKERVDVMVDGKLFTSYLYTSSLKNLKKCILFPVYSPNGNMITRGYPLETAPGERVDHPHQIGFWLNYGDVNGYDFWNNSDAIPPERQAEMGTIRHKAITKIDGNLLEVAAEWVTGQDSVLITEQTTFIFHADKQMRTIDRISRLTAIGRDVLFKDNKEGMIAIRVTRALEHPSDEPVIMTDASGVATEVPVMDNTGVTGHYTNSDGITGMDVWGKRAKWVMLSGVVNTEPVVAALFDHPKNVGYPTFWHARGYGLFAANPLGQKIFSEGQLELNFNLEKETSVTFYYRLAIYSGTVSREQMEEYYQQFITASP